MTLVLETLGSNETLNTRCLGVGFLAFALGLNFTADDEFADLVVRTKYQHPFKHYKKRPPRAGKRGRVKSERNASTHIIILPQPKELANLSRPLRPQPLRQHLVRDSRNLLVTLLDHTQCQHRQIHRNNAPPHTLPLPLPSPPGPITAVARAQQQADSRRVHDTLLHRKPLLVVAAGDLEDVAFEFGADAVALDFRAHAFFHEAAQFALVFDFDEFLGAIGRVGDVELHPDGLGG